MHSLIGIHAGLGEAGALAFLWVLVELLNPNESSIRRAKTVALIGTVFLFLSWFVGGYYYLEHYGPHVKALIKAGPVPWAHSVITETKEHVFLFLPFLAILTWATLKRYGNSIISDRRAKIAAIILAGLIVAIAFSMAGMGYLISSGFRSALESKVL